MAAVLHLPPSHSRPRSGTSPGILINPLPPQPSLSLPTTKPISNAASNNSLSSSSSGNNTDESFSSNSRRQSVTSGGHIKSGARSSSIPGSRRIRFAPLPDLRALDDAEDDENDVNDPAAAGVDGDKISNLLDTDSASIDVSKSPVPSLRLLKPNDSPPCGEITLNTSTLTLPDPFEPAITTVTCQPPTPSKKGSTSPTSSWTTKPRNLFRPFLKRSSSPMAPASSGFNISTEDILTLGTINLFRTSSKDSKNESGTSVSSEEGHSGLGLGLSLNRWTSANSGHKASGKEWFGSPLARTESTHSYKGDLRGRAPSTKPSKPKPKPHSSSSSPSSPLQTQVPIKSRRKGTRMLNGRVYGARRIDAQNTNMFVTAKDEEPEFVEWGYGGMGSVKAGKQNGGGGQWSRLQSDKAMGSGGAGAGVEDNLDDGGGMEWVRKRKEKKEREAREREEKAKGVVEVSLSPADTAVLNQPSDPPLVEEQQQQQQQPSSKDIFPPSSESAVSSPTQPTTPQDEPTHHITTTVTVPAPPPRPHHRTSSYSSSINTLHSHVNSNVNVNLAGSEGDSRDRVEMVSSPLGGSFVLGAGGGGGIESVSVGASDGDASGSESESESDSEVEADDDDDDEDEDEVFIILTFRNPTTAKANTPLPFAAD
ncbi:hypothetical protein PILCRDRAFT_85905 [Piloderma croceum F 1598]|uniref:Uncharacterized protein n=1 Tax=Piloderma croceum (strain F 1598) TaxID=765440 RepID=A0A0C3FTA8_PILCF|nr:hypothetical protein PILCRDRAFT_85905 [Piloderma croceum F 1598]